MSPGPAPPWRYRGLRFPRDARVLPPIVAQRMRAGTWQPGHTAAAFALARAGDRAVVHGAGTGHIAAILAGKLGLRHVLVMEPDADRRTYLARLARENGLARLAFSAPGPLAAFGPTLVFADLEAAAPMPDLACCPALRGVALHLPEHALERHALDYAVAAAGLLRRADLSRGESLVYERAAP